MLIVRVTILIVTKPTLIATNRRDRKLLHRVSAGCWPSAGRRGQDDGMSFVADDIGAWLIGLLAHAARRRPATWSLGTEQERALRDAATAAVRAVARGFRPDANAGTDEM